MVCFVFSLAPYLLCLQSVMGRQSGEEVEEEASVCGEGNCVEMSSHEKDLASIKPTDRLTCGPVARGDRADLRVQFLARRLEV